MRRGAETVTMYSVTANLYFVRHRGQEYEAEGAKAAVSLLLLRYKTNICSGAREGTQSGAQKLLGSTADPTVHHHTPPRGHVNCKSGNLKDVAAAVLARRGL